MTSCNFGSHWLIRSVSGLSTLVLCGMVSAQLNDLEQTPNTANAGIAKSLEEQIGPGRGDVNMFGSSIYMIKRDPLRSVRRGRQLFQRKFTVAQGMGPRTGDGVGDIESDGSLGAGLADSCAACHGRPKGSAGFGGDVFTRPDSRDAPHLFGLGLQEMLADEMTSELRAIRDQAVVDAQNGTGTSEGMVLIDEGFENGAGVFAFVDDPFGTSNPVYANEQLARRRGETVRAVTILGGIDNFSVSGLSGGWRTAFNLPAEATVKISFDYRLMQSNYESNEVSQARISVDGQETIVAERTGGGHRRSDKNTRTQPFSLELQLSAGTHTLVLGAFNSRKTSIDERTFVSYDNVKVSALTTTPGPVTKQLIAKGIDFGSMTAFPDGTVDTSDVEGVNPDLRVRPFFAEGSTISIREFVVGALNAEMGLEAPDPDLVAASTGSAIVTPAGMTLDGTIDTIEAPPVSSEFDDSDGDGVTNEIDTALVDHLEFYLLNYFKPGVYEQTFRTDSGLQHFESFGCAVCHVPSLTIDHDRRIADVETTFDPVNGIFNRLFAVAEGKFNEVDDGFGHPPLRVPAGNSFVVDNFYADLKRHDIGPAFWERNFDGTVTKEFMTEPLWGVGSSAPYGHDGRSISLEEVILRHGGEAEGAKNAFANAPRRQQHAVIDFLRTLVLFPPDDTASNLNPGDPSAADYPQNGHGSIKLSELFLDRSDPE